MFGLCSAASPCQAGDGAQPGAASAPCACSGSCRRAKLTPCEHPLSRAWGRAPSSATLLGEGWLPQELLLHPCQISPAVTGLPQHILSCTCQCLAAHKPCSCCASCLRLTPCSESIKQKYTQVMLCVLSLPLKEGRSTKAQDI